MTWYRWWERVFLQRGPDSAGGGGKEAREGAVGGEAAGGDLQEGEEDAVGVRGEGCGERGDG